MAWLEEGSDRREEDGVIWKQSTAGSRRWCSSHLDQIEELQFIMGGNVRYPSISIGITFFYQSQECNDAHEELISGSVEGSSTHSTQSCF